MLRPPAPRAEIAVAPDHARDVLAAGNGRGRTAADATLEDVKIAMHMAEG